MTRGIGRQVFGHDGLGPAQFSDTKPHRRFQALEVGFLDGYIRLGDEKLYIPHIATGRWK
jgi:hypothetical protein